MNQEEKKAMKLSPEELETATGGASCVYTDFYKQTNTYHCSNPNVTDELLRYSLEWSKACEYAGFDTQSCHKCWHLSKINT
jgi:hypothetical protein